MELSGTAALVTGGARRVGRAIVIELARAGCNLAIHYRRSRTDADQLAATVTEMGREAVIVEGDLCEPADWPRIIEQTVGGLGGLDILINNASMFLPEQVDTGKADTMEGFDLDLWESMFRVNVVAPAALCQRALKHLAARGRGRIVNLCDIAGDRPWPSALAYCASKAALAAVTKGLARAMAPEVRVNGVAPGIAVFPDEYSDKLRRSLTSQVPLGRAGTPDEVALLVRFLVESGDYITGQIVPIDGGRSIA